MKDVDFGSFRLSGFGFNTTLLVLNCTDLAKITFSVSKKKFWKYFSTDLKIRKIIFMPNPLGNLLIILGTGHFSSFRARKVKLTKLLTQPYISVPRQVTFFFFLSPAKMSILLHAKPFGKSFPHIGKRPFFKFQSQKVKIRCLTKKSLHFCLLSRVLIIGNYCYCICTLQNCSTLSTLSTLRLR